MGDEATRATLQRSKKALKKKKEKEKTLAVLSPPTYLTNKGSFICIYESTVFQKCATNLSTCLLLGLIYAREKKKFKEIIEEGWTRTFPIFIFRIWGIVRPRNIYAFHYLSTPRIGILAINWKIRTIMKQLPRFMPLIRPKLPGLSRRHHTHHPLPSVRAKLGQGPRRNR